MPALGLDIGGTKLLACLLDETSGGLRFASRPTGRDTPPKRLLALARDCFAELAAQTEIDTVGVGFPGPCDASHGVVFRSPMLDGWREVPLQALLGETLCRPTVIDNDANLALFGELVVRRGGPAGATVLVAIGTGIGGALAFDGRIWRGASGVAGEIGNTTIDHLGERCWCGRRGCLNMLASGTAISRDGGPPPCAEKDSSTSETHRREVMAEAIHALGEGLGNLLQILNPSLVILCGGVVQAGPRFVERVADEARRACFPEAAAACRFEAARLGYQAGAIGSALYALDRLGRLPPTLELAHG